MVLNGNRRENGRDAQQIESVLRKIADPRDCALFWLIYDGGLRCQEALAIDIDDISWSECSIRIHGKWAMVLSLLSKRRRQIRGLISRIQILS